MRQTITLFLMLLFSSILLNANAMAEDWKIDQEQSRVSFITVKQSEVGEVHTFQKLSGNVQDDGDVSVTISLNSVETNIDIRNERMRKLLFETETAPNAVVSLNIIDLNLSSLKVGERKLVNVTFNLDLHFENMDLDADMFVTRISDTTVLVETASPVLVHADDFNLGAGVLKLRELAGLDAISPIVPVTASLIFTR
ncbi:YceI family protein [Kordiimonas sp. SCSIO 12610]|uniref:YceI family protein n=1 Tax=Kordiimonas sp. SCSIO 12610 TaxID=2829597 RepID=UPI002108878B|nr:YceI family protein [Kordiimonas sp. SCSIO 12610]UTW53913.1 YceI family protein [Kordiimonas sp. SCSIO 12610]